MKKLIPFIPILGIPLVFWYHYIKLQDVGLENPFIYFFSMLVQTISLFTIYLIIWT